MIKITTQEYTELSSFVKVNYGMDLSSRKNFIEMRLQKLMEKYNYNNFTDYFNYICSDLTGVLVSEFINTVTVNYTLFYREAYHFDFLKNTVLPDLFQKEQSKKDLKIWSAGCSTGEEPYTIAMVLADFFSIYRSQWDTKILATDISTVALKKAIEGIYPYVSTEGLNPNWFKYYFIINPEEREHIHISPEIKKEVIFRKHNLVGENFNFKSKFHFIFCRNVMIYFDEPTKTRLLNRMYDSLEDGGFLFIGMSETIEKDTTKFKHINSSIYRKEVNA